MASTAVMVAVVFSNAQFVDLFRGFVEMTISAS